MMISIKYCEITVITILHIFKGIEHLLRNSATLQIQNKSVSLYFIIVCVIY